MTKPLKPLTVQRKASLFCGIDFGTSNSTIGLADAGSSKLVALEADHRTMPSAIFFNFSNGQVHFGRDAIRTYVEGEEGRFMRALKSVLGTSLIHEKTYIRAKPMSFMEILGTYFAYLKQRVEVASGGDMPDVVLGRPVHFVDGDEEADRNAEHTLEGIARQQGFRTIAFQYEPIAAALDYEQQVTREELVLVVDIGGGTSDFSIVRLSPDGANKADRKDDILATAGVHIGGTDFDRLLSLSEVLPHLGYGTYTADHKRTLPTRYYHDLATWHCINLLYQKHIPGELKQIRYEAEKPELIDRFLEIIDQRYGHLLALSVEKLKIDLSDQPSALLDFAPGRDWGEIRVAVSAFDHAIADSIERVQATIHKVLRQAGLPASAIDTVFLTGGSSSVPALRAGMLGLLPQARVVEGDLLGSVGVGLALDARRKFS